MSFGGGIAVSPLQLVAGVVPIVNGGIRYNPTLLAVNPNGPQPVGVRVMKQSTSDIMRKMMTDVVAEGTGVYAAVPGYIVGGKTGTAQVVGPNGRYLLHTNNASFMAAFPMQDPQYVVYVLVLQPKPDASTHGFTTGGYIAAPTVAQIIARIGPMLGIMPLSGSELTAQTAALDRAAAADHAARPARARAEQPAAAGRECLRLFNDGTEAAGHGRHRARPGYRTSGQRRRRRRCSLPRRWRSGPSGRSWNRSFRQSAAILMTERALPTDNEFAER